MVCPNNIHFLHYEHLTLSTLLAKYYVLNTGAVEINNVFVKFKCISISEKINIWKHNLLILFIVCSLRSDSRAIEKKNKITKPELQVIFTYFEQALYFPNHKCPQILPRMANALTTDWREKSSYWIN